MKIETAAEWVIRLVAMGLIGSIAISFPAWWPGIHGFPGVGMISDGQWLEGLEIVFCSLLLLSAGLLVIRPGTRMLQLGIPKLLFLLVTLDLIRLQPWVFLYGLILLGAWGMNRADPGKFLALVRIVLGFTYLWGGLQKLNPFFASEMFPWFLSAFGPEPDSISEWTGWLAAGGEAALGVFFLVRRTRLAGMVGLTAMHLFILLSLGPTGHNWNAVVWPWNLVFISLIWISGIWGSPEFPWKGGLSKLIVFLVAILPGFHFVGVGNHFLAGGYYTSLAPNAIFYFPKEHSTSLPNGTKNYLRAYEGDNESVFIPLEYWALGELHLPVYPEEIYYRSVGKKLCQCIEGGRSDAGIRMEIRSRWRKGSSVKNISCADLIP